MGRRNLQKESPSKKIFAPNQKGQGEDFSPGQKGRRDPDNSPTRGKIKKGGQVSSPSGSEHTGKRGEKGRPLRSRRGVTKGKKNPEPCPWVQTEREEGGETERCPPRGKEEKTDRTVSHWRKKGPHPFPGKGLRGGKKAHCIVVSSDIEKPRGGHYAIVAPQKKGGTSTDAEKKGGGVGGGGGRRLHALQTQKGKRGKKRRQEPLHGSAM